MTYCKIKRKKPKNQTTTTLNKKKSWTSDREKINIQVNKARKKPKKSIILAISNLYIKTEQA